MKDYFKVIFKIIFVAFPFIWCTFCVLFPLCIIFMVSISEALESIPNYTSLFTSSHGHVHIGICLSNYIEVFFNTWLGKIYFSSFIISFFVTFVCLLLAYPFSYYLTLLSSFYKNIVLFFLVVSCFIPTIIRAYSLMSLIENWVTLSLDNPFHHLYNYFFVILAMVYGYLPFMIFPIYISINSISKDMIETAYINAPSHLFSHIIVPMSKTGGISGTRLVMVFSLGECLIPDLISHGNIYSFTNIIWEECFHNRDLPMACTLTIYLFVMIYFSLCFIEFIGRRFYKS